jgi:hypothetical protein
MDEQHDRETKDRKERERQQELEQTWLAEQVQLIAIEDGFDS